MFKINNTYNETLTSSRPQFENPTSIPLEIPIGAIFETLLSQDNCTIGILIIVRYEYRTIIEARNFKTK